MKTCDVSYREGIVRVPLAVICVWGEGGGEDRITHTHTRGKPIRRTREAVQTEGYKELIRAVPHGPGKPRPFQMAVLCPSIKTGANMTS